MDLCGNTPSTRRRSIANERVLRDQLLCAAAEAPLATEDRARFVGGRDGSIPEESGRVYDRALDSLRRDGSLVERSKALCCRRSDTKHAKNVPLRVVDPVTIEVRINGVVLDTVPYQRAFYELFEGAIYLHQAPGRRPLFATSPRHRRAVCSMAWGSSSRSTPPARHRRDPQPSKSVREAPSTTRHAGPASPRDEARLASEVCVRQIIKDLQLHHGF